jgi:ribonuclease HI
MLFRKNILYIYTDGSSLPKPRKGGMGIRYVYLDDKENEIRIDKEPEGFKGATNNQMELMAVIEGIKNAKFQDIKVKYNCIEVRTDSRYVSEYKSLAIYNWSKNGWCNKNGKPIENAQHWKELIKVLKNAGCTVEIKWVKGHSNDPDNKAVDKIAKHSAITALNNPLVPVKLRRKKSNKKTKRGSVDMKGQRISIYIINDESLRLSGLYKYRYEVISKKSEFYENVDIIYSELYQLKAGHQYIVTFNKDNKNPRILKVIKELEKDV